MNIVYRLMQMFVMLAGLVWAAIAFAGGAQTAPAPDAAASSQATAGGLAVATVVVLREQEAVEGPVVNIFEEGEYLTSLMPGHYRQSAICAGVLRLGAHFTGSSRSYVEKGQGVVEASVAAGEEVYFRVIPGTSGKPALERLSAADAKALMARLQEQKHTLSRVGSNRTCER